MNLTVSKAKKIGDLIGVSNARSPVTTVSLSLAIGSYLSIHVPDKKINDGYPNRKRLEETLLTLAEFLPIDIKNILDIVDGLYIARTKIAFPEYTHPVYDGCGLWEEIYGVHDVFGEEENNTIKNNYNAVSSLYKEIRRIING